MSDPDKETVATAQTDENHTGTDVSTEDAAGADEPLAGETESPGTDEQEKTDTDTVAETAAPRRRGGGIALLALVISLLTLAGVGWLLYESWQARLAALDIEDPIAALTSRFSDSEQSLSALDRSIAELNDANRIFSSQLGALESTLDDRLGLIETLPQRMSSLENSVASLQGISTGARTTWLLAEAEYYMQIANAQLQLAGNPELAALALGMADERVNQIGDPGLTDVRRAIANELAALEIMEQPDIEGVSLTIASLARVIDSLPLKGIDGDETRAQSDEDSQATGVRRAWESVKGAMSSLVRVTPPDQAELPLVAPDTIYFLRTNLTLQLQAARLALLKGQQAVFEQSLDNASAWLQQYFDTESAQVNSALETIAEVRANEYSVTPPDISRSLRLLRQFRTLSESTE